MSPDRPPLDEYFDASPGRQTLGARRAAMVLPGLSIGFEGMDQAWHEAFLGRLRAYGRDGSGSREPFTMTLSACRAETEYFIDPPPPGDEGRYPLRLEVEADPDDPSHHRVRACTFCIAARFTSAGGAGRVIFSRGEFDPRERGVENILRVATAWLSIARGGLLMHSASIVKDGRAYLFFGQSGSGKSTLSASSRRGQVVSDDLTLLLPDDEGRPEVVGAPFRGTYSGGAPVEGRYPVAAAFRLKKAGPGETVAVEPLSPVHAMGGAIANLPFVVDQLHARPELFDRVEKVLASFPIRALRFRKDDDSFWDLID